MNQPIYAVLVVYNRSLSESPAFEDLRKFSKIQVFVCDNSTADYQNAPIAARYGMRYLSMGGNVGLAKAYNRAVQTICQEESGEAVICFFDDDTSVGADYVPTLRKACEQTPSADLFLPRVYDNVGLLSPCKRKGVRFVRCQEAELPHLSQEQLYGINSGMAVRKKLFQSHRYDEQYFLDYVDFSFLRAVKEGGAQCALLDTTLKQDFFAASDQVKAEAKRVRECIFQKDFSQFCKESFGMRLRGKCYLLGRKMKKWVRKG